MNNRLLWCEQGELVHAAGPLGLRPAGTGACSGRDPGLPGGNPAASVGGHVRPHGRLRQEGSQDHPKGIHTYLVYF